MFLRSVFGFYIVSLLEICDSYENVCDRRPLGTKMDSLLPDNQFVLDIDDIRANQYIPKHNYTVHLHARDGMSTFIGFTISLREDSEPNNNRKPRILQAGNLIPKSNSVVPHMYCNNTVIQSDITPKTSVEATWIAPDKGNKCVTIFAVVAVRPNVWYSFDGPLSRKVCEDPRKNDDMPPMENDRCEVCEDARYELVFQGLWSYNTHLDQFPPEKAGHAHFSDIVGASHDSESFMLYRIGSEATSGLKMLAEQGNTTGLEFEIEKALSTSVRTVVKATSPPEPNMPAITQFRASKDFHRLSIATAIIPSPDWFLGVSNMELCSTLTNQWAETITLNLYPLDAGTDKGTHFDSSNEVTLPHQAISLAVIGGERPKKPFARLELSLIRTYNTPDCSIEESTEKQGGENGDDDNDEGGFEDGGIDDGDNGFSEEPPYIPVSRTTTSEEPPSVDPQSTENCPMTPWEDWMPCQGECDGNVITGYKIRFRYHVVDGIAVGKYVENGPSFEDKVVPQYCLENEEDSQTEKCEEPCEDNKEEEEEESE